VIAAQKQMRTITNFFLANLAVADLCVGVFCVLPNLSTYLSPHWLLGRVREQSCTYFTRVFIRAVCACVRACVCVCVKPALMPVMRTSTTHQFVADRCRHRNEVCV